MRISLRIAFSKTYFGITQIMWRAVFAKPVLSYYCITMTKENFPTDKTLCHLSYAHQSRFICIKSEVMKIKFYRS